jgi:phage tail-like protein
MSKKQQQDKKQQNKKQQSLKDLKPGGVRGRAESMARPGPGPDRPGGKNSKHRPEISGRLEDLDPIRNFRFRVRIQPYSTGRSGWADNAFPVHLGFTSVSGLAVTMTPVPVQEGGLNTITHQLPGLASYNPVIFQRGIFLGGEENWQWIRRITGTIGNAGYGAPGGNFRCAVRIDVLSHPNPGSRAVGGGGASQPRPGFYDDLDYGTEVVDDHASISFMLSKAWISAIAYSDLNAGDSALIVEQMTLVHEGLHMDWSSDYRNGDKTNTANAFYNRPTDTYYSNIE